MQGAEIVSEQFEAHLRMGPALLERHTEERATLASTQLKASADLAMEHVEQNNRLHSVQTSELQALSNRTLELQTELQAECALHRQQLQAVSWMSAADGTCCCCGSCCAKAA